MTDIYCYILCFISLLTILLLVSFVLLFESTRPHYNLSSLNKQIDAIEHIYALQNLMKYFLMPDQHYDKKDTIVPHIQRSNDGWYNYSLHQVFLP